MGKKNRSSSVNKSSGVQESAPKAGSLEPVPEVGATSAPPFAGGLTDWLLHDYRGPISVLGFMFVGVFFGFCIGMGRLEGKPGGGLKVPAWKQNLGNKVRASTIYQVFTIRGKKWDEWLDRFADWVESVEKDIEAEEMAKFEYSHPRVFAVLREAVIREKGGYVHPDLGFMVPAPSGAARGLGMVRSSYHNCQVKCFPGTVEEKKEFMQRKAEFALQNATIPFEAEKSYLQEEVLVRVPLQYQMTRSVALDILSSKIPADVQLKAGFNDLGDAALLVLLLANERGVGTYSRWIAYINSMPPQPSCGYALELRPYMLDAIAALRDDLGMEVPGWGSEIARATAYADKIAESLDSDYGKYLEDPEDTTSLENIKWALCQVASRATAGSEKHGGLRLVPVVDLINHDVNAGGFIELTGKERIRNGDFLDATEDDSGTFVVRSLRHGRRKPLRKGQELMANYNVPNYSPLDWFVSLGFVPPERWGQWQRIEPVLPRVRTDGPFSEGTAPTADIWKLNEPAIIEHLRSIDL